MSIIAINSGNYGSTGNIMIQIADAARQAGHTAYTACPAGKSMRREGLENHMFIGNRFSRNLHLALSYISGFSGCFSYVSTKRFLKRLESLDIHIVHLHNLHNCYINIPLLFKWIKENNVRVVWTLHDCWSFTGKCPHFTFVKCYKWRSGCYNCPQYREYPESLIDQARMMWKMKKKWFSGVQDMTIVTPSFWLEDLVKQSYLKEYPIKVIHNGIDLSVFKPTDSNLRKEYKIKERYVILGVAYGWGQRKGLDIFVELHQRLNQSYRIILVGTDEDVDNELPDGIISIHRTQDRRELAALYTLSDVFVNPTREEALGLVNIESLSCGTPVITFDTGGSPECINQSCGIVVPCNDIEAMSDMIKYVCNCHPFSAASCIARANQFSLEKYCNDYLDIYGDIS